MPIAETVPTASGGVHGFERVEEVEGLLVGLTEDNDEMFDTLRGYAAGADLGPGEKVPCVTGLSVARPSNIFLHSTFSLVSVRRGRRRNCGFGVGQLPSAAASIAPLARLAR